MADHAVGETDVCGLNANSPHRLLCWNVWPPVNETVKGIGDVTLLEVMHPWEGALRSQRPTLGSVSLSLS